MNLDLSKLNDLHIAKSRLLKMNLSFVIVNDGVIILETSDHGIRALTKAVLDYNDKLEGAAIADRVVGKAAMLLIMRAKMNSLYAKTISSSALKLASKASVSIIYDNLVKMIKNRAGNDMCPFEKTVKNVEDPEEALKALSNKCEIR